MNLRDHQTDKTAAEKGKWFDYDGARFLIASSGTPAYQKAMSKRGRKEQAAIRRDDFGKLREVTIQVQADCILLGWEGVKDGESEFEYSRTNAVKLLTAAADFQAWVESIAMNLQNFIQEEEAADRAALKSGDRVGDGVGTAPGVPERDGGTNGDQAASTGD